MKDNEKKELQEELKDQELEDVSGGIRVTQTVYKKGTQYKTTTPVYRKGSNPGRIIKLDTEL